MVILNRPCPSKTSPVTVPSAAGSISRTDPDSNVQVAVSRVIVTGAVRVFGEENNHFCIRAYSLRASLGSTPAEAEQARSKADVTIARRLRK
jgi:hypothetical protein